MTLAENQTRPIERLHEFSSRVFMHLGVPRDDARIAADLLAAAQNPFVNQSHEEFA